MHSTDPEVRAKAKEGKRKGGRRSRCSPRIKGGRLQPHEIPETIETIEACLKVLDVATRAVLEAKIEPKIANSAVFGVSAIQKMLADHEFEKRVLALEEALSEQETSRTR
jgi:hypothetical protein